MVFESGFWVCGSVLFGPKDLLALLLGHLGPGDEDDRLLEVVSVGDVELNVHRFDM